MLMHPNFKNENNILVQEDVAIITLKEAPTGSLLLVPSAKGDTRPNHNLAIGGYGMRTNIGSKPWKVLLGDAHKLFDRCVTTNDGPSKTLPCSK